MAILNIVKEGDPTLRKVCRPVEKITPRIITLLDDMIARPHLYARGGNIVLVTTFLNDRMIGFHRAMQERGIQVIFFVATTYNNAIQIPGDVPVYFRVTQWIGGVGHAS
jgi:hypothetical protein